MVEACEIGATVQAQAQSQECGRSIQHPVDLTVSDADDHKENVDPGLPCIQQLRMRLLFSNSSETPVLEAESQDSQEVFIGSASAVDGRRRRR
jgi:hypothetical protein